MATDISNSADVIDSRDIIERIEELECYRDAAEEEATEHNVALDELEKERQDIELDDERLAELDERIEDHGPRQEKIEGSDGEDFFASADYGTAEEEELSTLKQLEDDCGSSEWRHGLGLIRETYFVEYCQELVFDIGDMPREIPSYIVIDWEATAKNIEADYSTVDYDGVEYLYRE